MLEVVNRLRTEAQFVDQGVCRDVFLLHGFPQRIITDQATHRLRFRIYSLSSFIKALNILKYLSILFVDIFSEGSVFSWKSHSNGLKLILYQRSALTARNQIVITVIMRDCGGIYPKKTNYVCTKKGSATI